MENIKAELENILFGTLLDELGTRDTDGLIRSVAQGNKKNTEDKVDKLYYLYRKLK